MQSLPATDRATLQKLISKGFSPPPHAIAACRIVRDDEQNEADLSRIAIFLPTMLDRLEEQESAEYLASLAAQLEAAARNQKVALSFYIALQHAGSRQDIAIAALEKAVGIIEAPLAAVSVSMPIVALVLDATGKVNSINEMTRLALTKDVEAVVLIDDDVSFSPNCFDRLIAAYLDRPSPCAIGARKLGRPLNTRASSILHKLKSFTQPAENYPHACCMIVSIEVISPRIPPIYSSDDGYICFRLLDVKNAKNPLHKLTLIDDAWCYHMVGGRNTVEIKSRIRRILLHHHLFLSHADPETSLYYSSQILFYGLWPWVPFDWSRGWRAGAIKCAIKYLYAIWFTKIAIELIMRGRSNRPMNQIKWGNVPE